jgi:hypothetical protein
MEDYTVKSLPNQASLEIFILYRLLFIVLELSHDVFIGIFRNYIAFSYYHS